MEESNLTYTVSVLRKTLDQSSGRDQYIQTIPKRGYRFIAQVKRLAILNPDGLDRAELEGPRGEEGTGKDDTVAIQIEGSELTVTGSSSAYGKWRGPHLREKAIESIAVLPFKLIGIGDEESHWGKGIADALITGFSNIEEVIVRPTSAVLKYDGTEQDVAAIGQELGVDWVLEGHLQRCDDRVRVNVQLVSALDGAPLWAESFDEQFIDIFTLEDHVSKQVTRALMAKAKPRGWP